MTNFSVMAGKPIWIIDLAALFPQELLDRTFDPSQTISPREITVNQLNIGGTISQMLKRDPHARVVFTHSAAPDIDKPENLLANIGVLFSALRLPEDERIQVLVKPTLGHVVETLRTENLMNGHSHVVTATPDLAEHAATSGTPSTLFMDRDSYGELSDETKSALNKAGCGLVPVTKFFWSFISHHWQRMDREAGNNLQPALG